MAMGDLKKVHAPIGWQAILMRRYGVAREQVCKNCVHLTMAEAGKSRRTMHCDLTPQGPPLGETDRRLYSAGCKAWAQGDE